MPSQLATKAIELLSPTVGDFVAKAKVSAACKLAGVDVEKLEKKDLGPFSEKLKLTCENLGAGIAEQIKKAVLAL